MSTTVIVVLIVIIVALVAVGGFLYLRHKRSERLREEFGSEYEREVAGAPSRAAAEKELHERQKRHRALDIRPLERDEREGYRESWKQVQNEFVDSPGDAVREADRLVIAIMRKRGYPTDDFDRRVADVSVDHPDVVEHYRVAHGVAVAHERGDAGTEDLRQAAIAYRSLVGALLDDRSEVSDRTESTNSTNGADSTNGAGQRPERSTTTDRSDA
jgi:hypothetical protein